MPPSHIRGGKGARPRCRRGVWLNASARPRNVSGCRLPPAHFDTLWRAQQRRPPHGLEVSRGVVGAHAEGVVFSSDHVAPQAEECCIPPPVPPPSKPSFGAYTASEPDRAAVPLLVAGGQLRRDLDQGCEFASVLAGIIAVLKVVPGSLGLFLRSTHLKLISRPAHTTTRDIFPMPWLPEKIASSGRAREKSRKPEQQTAVRLTNVWLAILNYLHWGPQFDVVRLHPTAAQSRARLSLLRRARDFLRRCPSAGAGGEALKSMLKVAADGYGARADVLPLGLRAGVPADAAVVDTAEVLRQFDPKLAEQCEEPSSLLIPSDQWPGTLPRGLKRLDRTYAALVDKAVDVNLMELGTADDVVRVGGEIAEQSGFAVPKDDLEDRWICCMEVTNKLVDPARLQRIHLPYMPQLATVSTVRGRRLVLTKRDARHYFHALASGKKWYKFMAQPAMRKGGIKKYPLLRAWPMGFRNSAIIDHRVTDVVVSRADLPLDCRFNSCDSTPLAPPLWTICLDDFVALHYQDDDAGVDWGHRVDAEWKSIGVSSHPKKTLDDAPNREMLGFQVGVSNHQVSLTPPKEWDLMQMILFVAMRWQYSVVSLQRSAGKADFAFGLRPSMRSILWMVYRVAADAQVCGKKRVGASVDVLLELVFVAMLMPLSRLSLQSLWCDRVVAHDAAPGGHGLAYTTLPPGEV